jgi:hypothetical protein
MQPHQQRVVTERDELAEKLTKLNAFTGTAVFTGLPEAEQFRLTRQAGIMKDYLDILNDRINAF